MTFYIYKESDYKMTQILFICNINSKPKNFDNTEWAWEMNDELNPIKGFYVCKTFTQLETY